MNTITYSVGLTEGREARCFLFSVFKMAILVTLVKIPTNLWKDQLPKTDGHLHRQNPLPAHGVEAKLTKKTNLKIQSNWLTDKKNMLFISESSPCMWSGKDLWTCPAQPKPRWRPLANVPGNGHDQDGYNMMLIKGRCPKKKRENVGILKKTGGGLPESHFHFLLFLTWETPQQ